MSKLFYTVLYCFLCCGISENLHAGVEVNFPKVNEISVNNLLNLANDAQDACRRCDLTACIRTMYTIKAQVEYMVGAKIQLGRFVDDAFVVAAKNGYTYTQAQKNQAKASILTYTGLVYNGVNDEDIIAFANVNNDRDVINLY